LELVKETKLMGQNSQSSRRDLNQRSTEKKRDVCCECRINSALRKTVAASYPSSPPSQKKMTCFHIVESGWTNEPDRSPWIARRPWCL